MAQPINSWSEFKKVLRQLENPEVQKKFSTVIVDTTDICYDYCTKYILANAKNSSGGYGVDKVSDIPFGQGYGLIEHEFDECLRRIIQLDYGLVMISHSADKAFTDEYGQEYTQVVPTLDKRATRVVSRMTDIIGYVKAEQNAEGHVSTKLFMRETPRYLAGSRFKYTPDYIDFTYDNLVAAINNAIDKQMTEDGEEYFTNERNNVYKDTSLDLDFDKLINTFNDIINSLSGAVDENTFLSYWQPRIIQITEKYLGKGQKVNQCSRDQTEALDLIVSDLQELVKQNQ